jgi:hypothetical protein
LLIWLNSSNEQGVTNEYKNLFASHAENNMDDLLQHVHPKVSADMIRSLLSAFTEEEVSKAWMQ